MNDGSFDTELDLYKHILSKKESELQSLQTQLAKLQKQKEEQDDEDELDELIDKWMEASHDMLYTLQSKTNPPLELSQVLDQLGIDHYLVHFDKENEAFF